MNKKAKSILAVSFIFLATIICSILIYNLFVSAASNVPVGLHFEGNETTDYDSDGIFSLNWTSGGGDAEANYIIWMSSDAGNNYGQYFNDSPTGYSITGGVDAENYTFLYKQLMKPEMKQQMYLLVTCIFLMLHQLFI